METQYVDAYIAMSTTVNLPQSRHSPLYGSHKSLLLRGALCISMYVTGAVFSCDTIQVFLCTEGSAVVILLSG